MHDALNHAFSAGLLPSDNSGCGRSSVVEHNLAKVGVESSNLFARSRIKYENKVLWCIQLGRSTVFFMKS